VAADQMLKAEIEGLDIGFHVGDIDTSELPSSYKKAGAHGCSDGCAFGVTAQ